MREIRRYGCVAATAVGVAAGSAAKAQSFPTYTVQRMGLTDADHTDINPQPGSQSSRLERLAPSGYAAGTSVRRSGGDSAWFHDPATGLSQRIGLVGEGYTDSFGNQIAAISGISSGGFAIGYSRRFSGTTDLGRSAWRYDHAVGTTTRIGLFEAAEFTGPTGFQYSIPTAINASGQVIGTTWRISSTGGTMGEAAWTFDPASRSTLRLGYTGAEYTSQFGRQVSQAEILTPGGKVAGYSERYSGTTLSGTAAWVYDRTSGQTTRMGLTGSGYVSSDGRQASSIRAMHDSGFVAGTSSRYSGASDRGPAAWVFNPSSGQYTRVGLFDGAHSYMGTQVSQPVAITSDGRTMGFSVRYAVDNLVQFGRSAWYHDPSLAASRRIGLTDAAHTGAAGYQYNEPMVMNESGRIAGTAMQFNAQGSGSGRSVWTYEPQADATTRIGLYEGVHSANGTVQYNNFVAMNAAGMVLGTARRYAGSGENGQSGWLFDPATGLTHTLAFAVGSDGYAFTEPTILTQSGAVLGRYERVVGLGHLGPSAFAWNQSLGFVDLGELVDGGLSASGWASLDSVLAADEMSAIAGYGSVLAGGSKAVYLLVPAPGSVVLGAVIFLAGARRRR